MYRTTAILLLFLALTTIATGCKGKRGSVRPDRVDRRNPPCPCPTHCDPCYGSGGIVVTPNYVPQYQQPCVPTSISPGQPSSPITITPITSGTMIEPIGMPKKMPGATVNYVQPLVLPVVP